MDLLCHWLFIIWPLSCELSLRMWPPGGNHWRPNLQEKEDTSVTSQQQHCQTLCKPPCLLSTVMITHICTYLSQHQTAREWQCPNMCMYHTYTHCYYVIAMHNYIWHIHSSSISEMAWVSITLRHKHSEWKHVSNCPNRTASYSTNPVV